MGLPGAWYARWASARIAPRGAGRESGDPAFDPELASAEDSLRGASVRLDQGNEVSTGWHSARHHFPRRCAPMPRPRAGRARDDPRPPCGASVVAVAARVSASRRLPSGKVLRRGMISHRRLRGGRRVRGRGRRKLSPLRMSRHAAIVRLCMHHALQRTVSKRTRPAILARPRLPGLASGSVRCVPGSLPACHRPAHCFPSHLSACFDRFLRDGKGALRARLRTGQPARLDWHTVERHSRRIGAAGLKRPVARRSAGMESMQRHEAGCRWVRPRAPASRADPAPLPCRRDGSARAVSARRRVIAYRVITVFSGPAKASSTRRRRFAALRN